MVINDLTLFSVTNTDEGTKYTFSFKRPATFLGGYELVYSYNAVEYIFACFKPDIKLKSYGKSGADTEFVRELNGIIYFDYVLPTSSIINGHKILFKVNGYSTDRSVTFSSNIINTYTTPSSPIGEDIFIGVTQYVNTIKVSWLDVDYANDMNKDIKRVDVKKHTLTNIGITKLESDMLYSASIAEGNFYVVYDYKYNSFWRCRASSAGKIQLSNNLIENRSHVYTVDRPIDMHNLKLYLVSDNCLVIGSVEPSHVTGQKFEVFDNAIANDSIVAYSVNYIMPDEQVFTSDVSPILLNNLNNIVPSWRLLEKSNTPLLKSLTWKRLKNALVDKNYYDKSYWAIPYSDSMQYSLIGFIGVANCLVDIFINKTLYTTVTSNDYGEFELKYKFPLESVSIYVQARSKDNTLFSKIGHEVTIRAYYVYSALAVLSTEFNKIRAEQHAYLNKLSIDSCSAQDIRDIYTPQVGFDLIGDESIEVYRSFVKKALILYSYIGYEKAYQYFTDMFTELVPSVDRVEYFKNASFEDSYITGKTFIPIKFKVDDIANPISRKKYIYGVSALRINSANQIEETSPARIIVDNRWMPTSGMGVLSNILTWDRVNQAQSYAIYRGEYDASFSFEELLFSRIAEIKGNTFVDMGDLTQNQSQRPFEFNSTIMDSPKNVQCLNNITLHTYGNLLKKPYYYTIIVYMKGDAALPAYLISRLISILNIITPAEQFYTVIIANNSSVSLYNKQGTKLN